MAELNSRAEGHAKQLNIAGDNFGLIDMSGRGDRQLVVVGDIPHQPLGFVKRTRFQLMGTWVTSRRENASWFRETLFAALSDAKRYVKLVESRLDAWQSDPRLYGDQKFLEPGDATAIWGRLSALNAPVGAALEDVMTADSVIQAGIQQGNYYVLVELPVRQPDGEWRQMETADVYVDDDDQYAKTLRDAIARFFAAADAVLTLWTRR
jgi:hypothetical protein